MDILDIFPLMMQHLEGPEAYMVDSNESREESAVACEEASECFWECLVDLTFVASSLVACHNLRGG